MRASSSLAWVAELGRAGGGWRPCVPVLTQFRTSHGPEGTKAIAKALEQTLFVLLGEDALANTTHVPPQTVHVTQTARTAPQILPVPPPYPATPYPQALKYDLQFFLPSTPLSDSPSSSKAAPKASLPQDLLDTLEVFVLSPKEVTDRLSAARKGEGGASWADAAHHGSDLLYLLLNAVHGRCVRGRWRSGRPAPRVATPVGCFSCCLLNAAQLQCQAGMHICSRYQYIMHIMELESS
jgi:hypothetical protein